MVLRAEMALSRDTRRGGVASRTTEVGGRLGNGRRGRRRTARRDEEEQRGVTNGKARRGRKTAKKNSEAKNGSFRGESCGF